MINYNSCLHIIWATADTNDIASHRVLEIIVLATCNTDDVESVTMEMERVLLILLD